MGGVGRSVGRRAGAACLPGLAADAGAVCVCVRAGCCFAFLWPSASEVTVRGRSVVLWALGVVRPGKMLSVRDFC